MATRSSKARRLGLVGETGYRRRLVRRRRQRAATAVIPKIATPKGAAPAARSSDPPAEHPLTAEVPWHPLRSQVAEARADTST